MRLFTAFLSAVSLASLSAAVLAAPIPTGTKAFDDDPNEISFYFAKIDGKNDCAGYFNANGRNGFENCTAGGSPVIAKWDAEKDKWEINSIFPSVTGDEFTIEGVTIEGDKIGEWFYSPGADDPAVRYWVAKGGNSFNIFWFGTSDPSSAQPVTSGAWFTPSNRGGQAGLSHLTFYDTGLEQGPPEQVPEPAALALLGIGGIGLAWMSRRQRRR